MHLRPRRPLVLVVAGVAGAALIGVAGAASAATDPVTPPTFSRTNVDSALTGSAFSASSNLKGDTRPEIVATGYGTFSFGPMGPIPPAAGTVQSEVS